MSNTVIKVENLSKQYRLGTVGTGTISHDLNRWWHKVRGKEDPYLKIGESNDRASKGESEYVWALKDINFEVKQGEVLGIIGKNGAGKSTLLKILSKVTGPTTGSIKAKGRIASLLEVGTGFHPELTGRENIYLNGTILGMTKREVDKKLDEIVDFAGVARYIDTPVKRYSSGMTVRLGFAVAAHLEPEILVVDEVLAVGDAEFQKKAIGKMQEVSQEGGRTVLFVSHNMASVQTLCSKTMFLRNGGVENFGNTGDIINQYLSEYNSQSGKVIAERKDRNGNGKVRFADFWIENHEGKRIKYTMTGSAFILAFKLNCTEVSRGIDVGFSLHNALDLKLSVLYSSYQNKTYSLDSGENIIVKVLIPECYFGPGIYTIKGRIIADNEEADWPKFSLGALEVIGGNYFEGGNKGFQGNSTVLIRGVWN